MSPSIDSTPPMLKPIDKPIAKPLNATKRKCD